jgi:hypothetical protein
MKITDINFNILHNLLLNKLPKYLGNISLDNEDIFTDMTEVMDFLNNNYDINSRRNNTHLSMIEIHRIWQKPDCPKLIKDISTHLKNFNPFKNRKLHTIGIIGLENSVGYDWHYDYYHIVAMNIIGETTWYFRDNDEVKMKPGDLMFIPSPIEHKVIGSGERFSLTFSCMTNKNLHEKIRY